MIGADEEVAEGLLVFAELENREAEEISKYFLHNPVDLGGDPLERMARDLDRPMRENSLRLNGRNHKDLLERRIF